eukprot:jgi/Botrbrau1/18420/Bobra.0072s0012.1
MGPVCLDRSSRGLSSTRLEKLGLFHKNFTVHASWRARIPSCSLRGADGRRKAYALGGGKYPSQDNQKLGAENSSNEGIEPAPTLWDKVKAFFTSGKIDRERLAKLGLGAVASYGLVSNITYGAGMAVSWILFVKQTGKSPLMSGQWKAFLAFYAGFWTMQHIVRPLRFSLALAMAPLFDKFIDAIQTHFKFSNRRDAFGVYLVILGTLTSVLVFGSIRVFGGPHAFARTIQ